MMAQMSSINVKYIIATHELSLLDFKIIQLAELESNMSDQYFLMKSEVQFVDPTY